jgi:thioredoxin-dependent peroxiredoxin
MNVVALLLALLVIPNLAEADMLNPGDRFPDWSLSDHAGQMVSSKDMAGKTYLLWYYPKASTPG